MSDQSRFTPIVAPVISHAILTLAHNIFTRKNPASVTPACASEDRVLRQWVRRLTLVNTPNTITVYLIPHFSRPTFLEQRLTSAVFYYTLPSAKSLCRLTL